VDFDLDVDFSLDVDVAVGRNKLERLSLKSLFRLF
jgi:hypothetical protein